MILRCLLILFISAIVTGCETKDTIGDISYRPYDPGFQRITLTSNGTFADEKTDIYMRRLQNGGKLEICGFYIMSSGISEDLTSEWLKYAKVTIDGEEIVSSKFLRPQERLEGAKSNCVVTVKTYQTDLLKGRMSLRGRAIRLLY
ncbi:hypothetical protein [Sneathiella sp. HT1-7]|jgi:hypothetical protein|uniref:hypothetical protein n=1 Tax=Sneathiella sp. HT1-7 TaxID=2887192 RepID=UPI001D13966E|nr:hypothetical protein [Sneathiella sp. HT1-7]MCC3304981.1 hypothetical protein [Sneathiella sp. HT1-7]